MATPNSPNKPNTPIRISDKSQQAIIQFGIQAYNLLNQQWNLREQMRQVDLAYIREVDWTLDNQRAKLANRSGDTTRIQNVTIPVVMPQVEAATTYQTSVFLTGIPLFGVVADPLYENEARQLESVIDEQAIRWAWKRELMLHFRNGFKYNLAALEVDWCQEITPAFDTDLTYSLQQGKPKELLWEGNRVRNLNPYNVFFDSRVPITEMHRYGEFAGKTELFSRVRLKQFIASLPDKMVENIVTAFESGIGSPLTSGAGIQSYYVPDINQGALLNKNKYASTDWLAWANVAAAQEGTKIQYKNMYEVTTLYARIMPIDFGIRVPSPATPQIWKFIIINHKVLIYAERQTNAHNYLPILFSQPLEDGLEYQTKSLATNVKNLQEVSSALMTSVLASRRRAISDRCLYDPSRISADVINSDSPSAKMPVRPSAYGTNIADAVYQFPYRDDQAPQLMQDIQFISNTLANSVTGSNPARQGQFVKGNKTLHEFQDTMGNSTSRDQLCSLLLEDQLFNPLKEILKINILQYQGGTEVYNREQKAQVQVDPLALRKAVLQFKVSDGLVPTDKLINADTMQVALQIIGSSPQIGAAYNLAPFVSYLLKTQGADMTEFEKSPAQQAYEQALNAWSQQMQQLSLSIQKGSVDPKSIQFPPQPLPQQYGYTPPPPPGVQSQQSQQGTQTDGNPPSQ